MQRSPQGLVYSPQDLIGFINSLFACWMDRYALENPGDCTPDDEPDELLNASKAFLEPQPLPTLKLKQRKSQPPASVKPKPRDRPHRKAQTKE
jgi:hypothetical protein